jgi:hypothetical protein
MYNLEEKLSTCESYSLGSQGNFHNLEVTHAMLSFRKKYFKDIHKKIVMLDIEEGF